MINTNAIEMLATVYDTFRLYASSRISLILFTGLLFGLIRLSKILYNYNKLRIRTNMIPGINCHSYILGNLSVITSGINPAAGVDAYQGKSPLWSWSSSSCYCYLLLLIYYLYCRLIWMIINVIICMINC